MAPYFVIYIETKQGTIIKKHLNKSACATDLEARIYSFIYGDLTLIKKKYIVFALGVYQEPTKSIILCAPKHIEQIELCTNTRK